MSSTLTRYVVSRLYQSHVRSNMVLLTKVNSVEHGIDIGLVIENRGTAAGRWSFVGQIESDRRDLEQLTGSAGISDDRLLLWGIDVREKGSK